MKEIVFQGSAAALVTPMNEDIPVATVTVKRPRGLCCGGRTIGFILTGS